MSKILVDEMPSRPVECPFCEFIPDGHSPFSGDVKCLLTNLECNCDLLTNSKCGFLAELSNGKEEGLDLLENGDGLQIGDKIVLRERDGQDWDYGFFLAYSYGFFYATFENVEGAGIAEAYGYSQARLPKDYELRNYEEGYKP